MSEKILIVGMEFTKAGQNRLFASTDQTVETLLVASEVEQALREKDEKFKRFDNAYRLLEADYRKSQSQLAEKDERINDLKKELKINQGELEARANDILEKEKESLKCRI